MTFGQLSAQSITQINTPEVFYQAKGQGAIQLTVVNRSSSTVAIDIAHVPDGQSLQDHHWILWNEKPETRIVTEKLLINKNDTLYIQANSLQVHVIANGVGQ